MHDDLHAVTIFVATKYGNSEDHVLDHESCSGQSDILSIADITDDHSEECTQATNRRT